MLVKKYTNPWGQTYKEKNQFQEYFIAVVQAVEDEEWFYVRQLTDELTQEQKWDLWGRLASYTRRLIKENDCIDIQPP